MNINLLHNDAELIEYTPECEKYFDHQGLIEYINQIGYNVKVDEIRVTGRMFQVKHRTYKTGDTVHMYSVDNSIRYISSYSISIAVMINNPFIYILIMCLISGIINICLN